MNERQEKRTSIKQTNESYLLKIFLTTNVGTLTQPATKIENNREKMGRRESLERSQLDTDLDTEMKMGYES